MKKMNQKIIVSIFIFIIILLLSISIIIANNTNNNLNAKIDKEKIYYEIKYFDNILIEMINSLNNIKLESNFEINWNELQNYQNNLYIYWNSAILDLSSLDIDNQSLINFGKDLDKLSVSIKDNNKNTTLIFLIKLYSNIIIYSNALNYNNYSDILITKYNLLLSYKNAETDNWTLVHENILEASKKMYIIVNWSKINKYEQYNINQAYISIKEMENLISIKDINLYYMKYLTALNRLQNISI